jgi:hypothetical protein
MSVRADVLVGACLSLTTARDSWIHYNCCFTLTQPIEAMFHLFATVPDSDYRVKEFSTLFDQQFARMAGVRSSSGPITCADSANKSQHRKSAFCWTRLALTTPVTCAKKRTPSASTSFHSEGSHRTIPAPGHDDVRSFASKRRPQIDSPSWETSEHRLHARTGRASPGRVLE